MNLHYNHYTQESPKRTFLLTGVTLQLPRPGIHLRLPRAWRNASRRNSWSTV